MRIAIIAHPNAKKPRVETDLTNMLHVYVHEPPLESRANQAIVKALAKHFGVKKNQVSLLTGEKNKQKTFEITK